MQWDMWLLGLGRDLWTGFSGEQAAPYVFVCYIQTDILVPHGRSPRFCLKGKKFLGCTFV